MNKLTAERLRDVLHYDPATGVLTWKKRSNRAHAGQIAGCCRSDGYVSIRVDGKDYLAHRLAWLHVHGGWPIGEVDHRNMTRSDNRIENLRDATPAQNRVNSNAYRNNKCGVKGVHFDKRQQKWRADIGYSGRYFTIGYFSDIADAGAAYARRATEVHGEFARWTPLGREEETEGDKEGFPT